MKKSGWLIPIFGLFFAACETVTAEIEYGDERDKALDDDEDGLSNFDEAQAGTDPNVADSDGDGINDKDEVEQGFDPLDAADKPYLGGYPVARCDSLPAATGNDVGEVTDDFNLLDQNGERVYLQDFCNSVVILEASNFG